MSLVNLVWHSKTKTPYSVYSICRSSNSYYAYIIRTKISMHYVYIHIMYIIHTHFSTYLLLSFEQKYEKKAIPNHGWQSLASNNIITFVIKVFGRCLYAYVHVYNNDYVFRMRGIQTIISNISLKRFFDTNL